jgi:AcrR family transcriptional regulator
MDALQANYTERSVQFFRMNRDNNRDRILEAAEAIVKTRGAGKLTYDELARESGFTRGGLTYHFPTKDSLLQALLERDVEQWQAREQSLRPTDAPTDAAELIGYLRAFTVETDEKRRFVAGMLSAVAHDHSLLDPVRRLQAERVRTASWDQTALRQQLLRFAAEGLFWSEFFRCTELPADVRERLVTELEALARAWSPGDDAASD